MHTLPRLPRWPIKLLLLFWSVPVLLGLPFSVFSARTAQSTVSLWRICVVVVVSWQVWAVLSIAVVTLADRIPVQRPWRWRTMVAHVCAALLACAIQAATTAAAVTALRLAPGTSFVQVFLYWCLLFTPAGVIVYAAVVAVRTSQQHHAMAMSHAAASRQLTDQLALAQLQALRAQTQPHFLFNTLNAVIALVRGGDGARATEALLDLSALLRASLRSDASVVVPLKDDLDFVQHYLAIEQMRLGDRLQVTISVPPQFHAVPVPSLCLQPLVENAIRHGLRSVLSDARLAVSAHEADGNLVLQVIDNGVGVPTVFSIEQTPGIGLRAARARLHQLFGERAELSVLPGEAGRGTVSRVTIPMPANV